MRYLNVINAKFADIYGTTNFNFMQRYTIQQTGFAQLPLEKIHSKWCGVDRAIHPRPKMSHCTKMIFMRMCKHKANEVLAAFFNEGRIRKQQIDAGQGVIGKCQTAVDGKPFTVAAIERHVHADFACATQRDKKKFVSQKIKLSF